MRGKVLVAVGAGRRGGITPAYAGKRIKLRKRHSICGDYPRVCGEKINGQSLRRSASGSPPRMRGKVYHLLGRGHADGITPAHAGKRDCSSGIHEQTWDHPRACGEKGGTLCGNFDATGSPPRMRGKVALSDNHSLFLGITPAHAGKREFQSSQVCFLEDHPRACGEKQIPHADISRSKGSPPRMRGKEFPWTSATARVGITPAHAGKRSQSMINVVKRWDHPRACGEK